MHVKRPGGRCHARCSALAALTHRVLAWFAVAAVAATFVAISLVDRPVAQLIHGSSLQDPWILREVNRLLDLVTGKSTLLAGMDRRRRWCTAVTAEQIGKRAGEEKGEVSDLRTARPNPARSPR